MRDHRSIDDRSKALAEAIADRLGQDPTLIAHARTNLERWSGDCSPGVKPAFEEWRSLLDGPVEKVIALLRSDDQRAVRLRQSNPFAGVLPQDIRNEIFLRFHARDQATA